MRRPTKGQIRNAQAAYMAEKAAYDAANEAVNREAPEPKLDCPKAEEDAWLARYEKAAEKHRLTALRDALKKVEDDLAEIGLEYARPDLPADAYEALKQWRKQPPIRDKLVSLTFRLVV